MGGKLGLLTSECDFSVVSMSFALSSFNFLFLEFLFLLSTFTNSDSVSFSVSVGIFSVTSEAMTGVFYLTECLSL